MTNQKINFAIRGYIVGLGAAAALATAVAQEPKQAVPPRGYLVANFTIMQQQLFDKYLKAAGSIPAQYKGKVIIYDKAKALEGNPQSMTVVVEFPTVADAERFYNSPEYTAVKGDRIASAVGTVVLAEGIPPKQ